MPPKSKTKDTASRKIQDEIHALKSKLGELETQIKEENRVNSKLCADADQKKNTVHSLENQIASENERLRFFVENALNKRLAYIEHSEKRIEQLKEKEKQLIIEISSYDLVLERHEKLQLQLKDCINEFNQVKQQQFEELDKKRQDNFDTRMKLDQVLRDTIKVISKDYEQHALQKMDLEALLAAEENVKLYAEFDYREKTCEDLIRRQKQSYEEITKLRIVQGVVSTATTMHEESAYKLRMEKEDHHKKIVELSNSMVGLRKDLNKLQGQVHLKKKISKQLFAVKSELKAIRRFSHHIRKQALALANMIVQQSLEIAAKDRSYYNKCLAQSFLSVISVDSDKGDMMDNTIEAVNECRILTSSTSSTDIAMKLNPIIITDENNGDDGTEVDYSKCWSNIHNNYNYIFKPLRQFDKISFHN